MTKAYYYCSYTASPVGFLLGSVEVTASKRQTYEQDHTCALQMGKIPVFVRDCFESSLISRAAGSCIGFDNHQCGYFLLIKGLDHISPNCDPPLIFDLNIAMETNDRAQYERWFSGSMQESKHDIATAIAATIRTDTHSAFGYELRADRLLDLCQADFSSLFPEHPSSQKTTVWLSSNATTPDALSATFSSPISSVEFKRSDNTILPARKTQKVGSDMSAVVEYVMSLGDRNRFGRKLRDRLKKKAP
ncbi:MAG: hypothetical protein HDQ87_09120 [Clostridia bacterium]|nr:hypothetical protein [Clostridia bacterium]